MLNFKNEPALSPCELAQRISAKEGVSIHHNTVREWIKRGVRGIKLEGRIIGNRYFSTWGAYERFDAKRNGE